MRIRRLALIALAVLVGSCSDQLPTGSHARPAIRFDGTGTLTPVRFAEIHYDNTGTDVGEAIEVSGPAGMDVTGWQVVLYNGTGGAAYGTTPPLSGAFPATCTTRGVMVINYPSNGIQNGSPDGMALVDAGGTVVEFLSYEGTFAATNGPALGLTSTDIGVAELGTEPAGMSLQRNGGGTWSGPVASTFGACNDDQEQPPPAEVASVTVAPASLTVTQGGIGTFTAAALDAASQPVPGVTFTWSSSAPTVATVNANGVATAVAPGDATITATAPNGVAGSAALHVDAPNSGLPVTRFSEIHYDNVGTDVGEAIEIEGPAGMSVTGWSIVLYNGTGGAAYNSTTLSGTIPATCDTRGVLVVDYPTNGIQNGSPDGMALVDAGGLVVEFLSYEGTFVAADGPAVGVTSTDIIAAENSDPIGRSLQRDAFNRWSTATSTFGACNAGGTPPPPPGTTITFSGRSATSDPALPVGFQDQLFVTVKDGSGATITPPITWSSDTPTLATIDQRGVFTGLAEGTAIFRATTEDNSATATYALPIRVATASTTAQYAGNTEFGEPTDADPSDDFIVRRAEYTTSFNQLRGIPNWVSYDMDATVFGSEDRCDCFTYDPELPASFTRYTTADYTGAGTFAGYGIDRGHLTRSFDRTSASLDNATTFYFSNVVPQAADLNQGPWANMENYLGDLARLQNMEVYVIAGASGSKGTVKNEGLITIPAYTWKVAVILPRDQGLANIQSPQDLQVIAAIMPNEPGVRNVDWNTYRTTVDAVEALSGYDLLAALPDQVEIAVESNTSPPVAAVDGPYVSNEGSAVALSGASSSDPDGDALTYQWDFGDGALASGPTVSHTWAQDGVYTVRMVVTDTRGLTDAIVTTATVSNVAPVVGNIATATLLPGETYTTGGTFTDPGADPWTATVDYGDGTGTAALALSGMQFTLSHKYSAAGSFAVTVNVSDGAAVSSGSQVVVVLTLAQGAQRGKDLVAQLFANGKIGRGAAVALTAELEVARQLLERGRVPAAGVVLRAILIELDALVRSGRLASADAAPLRLLIVRLIPALTA
jgi:DNA/RNA endonuclease G (NUC1)